MGPVTTALHIATKGTEMTDPGKRPEDEHEELDRVTAKPTGQVHPEEDQSD